MLWFELLTTDLQLHVLGEFFTPIDRVHLLVVLLLSPDTITTYASYLWDILKPDVRADILHQLQNPPNALLTLVHCIHSVADIYHHALSGRAEPGWLKWMNPVNGSYNWDVFEALRAVPSRIDHDTLRGDYPWLVTHARTCFIRQLKREDLNNCARCPMRVTTLILHDPFLPVIQWPALTKLFLACQMLTETYATCFPAVEEVTVCLDIDMPVLTPLRLSMFPKLKKLSIPRALHVVDWESVSSQLQCVTVSMSWLWQLTPGPPNLFMPMLRSLDIESYEWIPVAFQQSASLESLRICPHAFSNSSDAWFPKLRALVLTKTNLLVSWSLLEQMFSAMPCLQYVYLHKLKLPPEGVIPFPQTVKHVTVFCREEYKQHIPAKMSVSERCPLYDWEWEPPL